MANPASNKRILIALFYDYHLFPYFEDLVPALLSDGLGVELLTSDKGIRDKFSHLEGDEGLILNYAEHIRPLMRLMDIPVLRPLIWIYGWVWSYFATKECDLVILPRDTKPFQYMIGKRKPVLLIQPGMGKYDKLFLRHKYKGEPFVAPSIKSKFPMIDRLFGCGYLKNVYKPSFNFNFTVIGQDFQDFFIKMGVDAERIYVTGNPNYNGITSILVTNEDAAKIRAEYGINEAHIGVYFPSHLNFSDEILERLAVIARSYCEVFKSSCFTIKVHPRLDDAEHEKLLYWAGEQVCSRIVIIKGLVGDENNMRLIKMSHCVMIEESNVGILALWSDKPMVILNLEQGHESLFSMFDGVLSFDFDDAHAFWLRVLDPVLIENQRKVSDKISKKVSEPVLKICDAVVDILDRSS